MARELFKEIQKHALSEFIDHADIKSIFSIGETVMVFKRIRYREDKPSYPFPGRWVPAIVSDVLEVFADGRELIKVMPKLQNGKVGSARQQFYTPDDPNGVMAGNFHASTVIKIKSEQPKQRVRE